jgi:chromosome segregation protein
MKVLHGKKISSKVDRPNLPITFDGPSFSYKIEKPEHLRTTFDERRGVTSQPNNVRRNIVTADSITVVSNDSKKDDRVGIEYTESEYTERKTRDGRNDEDSKAMMKRKNAQDLRNTNMHEWNSNIQSLEHKRQVRDREMQDALNEKTELEKQIEMLRQKTNGRSSESRRQSFEHIPPVRDRDIQEVLNEKAELIEKIELLQMKSDGRFSESRRQSFEHIPQVRDRDMQEVLNENAELETMLKWGNDGRFKESQRQLNQTKLFQKTVRELERALLVARDENAELRSDRISRKSNFEKTEQENTKIETEIATLRSELEMNRRIVHAKRGLIQKEITEDIKEQFRIEIRNEIRKEISEKTTREVETKMKEENDKEVKGLRNQLQKVVEDNTLLQGEVEKSEHMGQSIRILENEIAGLQRAIYNLEDNHAVELVELKDEFTSRKETMKKKLAYEREREKNDFTHRIEALSKQNERQMQRAEIQKNVYGIQVKEEVTKGLQGEIKLLTDTVAELKAGNQKLLSTTEKEKEEQSEQMTKERNELLEETAKEKELYGEQIRQELMEESKLEIDNVNGQINELTSDKHLILNRVNELEKELSFTQENHDNNVAELDRSESALKMSKNEIFKLKKNKRDLTTLADKYKKDFADATIEANKRRGHFKHAVLVESEEKIIKLEGEVRDLESIIEQSRKDNLENVEMVATQASLLKEYKAKRNVRDTIEYKKQILELQDNVRNLESVIEKEISEKALLLKELKTSMKSQIETSELLEMKRVISQKEAENFQLNQDIGELQSSFGDCGKELIKIRNKLEASEKERISLHEYEERITLLGQEVVKYRSLLENCHCESSRTHHAKNDINEPDRLQHSNSDQQQQRIERLRLMLKATEKNHTKEKSDFEESKNQFNEKLSDCKDEIEGLHLEIAGLRYNLCQSQKDPKVVKVEEDERLHRINTENNDLKSKLEKMEVDNSELKEELVYYKRLLRENVMKSEKTISEHRGKKDHTVKEMEGMLEALSIERGKLLSIIEILEKTIEEEKIESETLIQDLKNKLSYCNAKNLKVEKKLQNSKLLFREAIISWRSETRDLNQQLDQLRDPEHHSPSYSSPNSIGEDSDSDLRDDVSDLQSPHNEDTITSKCFSELLEIDAVGDSLEIEMTINAPDSQTDEEMSNVTDNLRSFKYDFDRFLDDTTVNNKLNNFVIEDGNSDDDTEEVRDDPESRIIPPPQPHQDDDGEEEENRSLRERSSLSRRNSIGSESRDGSASTISHQDPNANGSFKSRDFSSFPITVSMTRDLDQHAEDYRSKEDSHSDSSLRHPEMLRLEEMSSLKRKIRSSQQPSLLQHHKGLFIENGTVMMEQKDSGVHLAWDVPRYGGVLDHGDEKPFDEHSCKY